MTFRLQNQRIFLTYSRCNWDRETYIGWIYSTFGKTYSNISFVRVAYEVHAENEEGECPEHRHVLINFGKAFQSRNPRVFDYLGIHPNIQKVGNSAVDWGTLLCYMGKEDLTCKDLKVLGQKYLNIWTAESSAHAMIDCPSVSPMNIKIAYEAGKKANYILDEVDEPNCPWYSKFKEYQRNEIPGYDKFRNVIWISDSCGDSQKTLFAKWAFDKEDYCVVNAFWRATDFSRLIKNKRDNGWTSKYLVIALPREWNDDGCIYTCIENAKDGIITSMKYDSDSFRIRDDVMVLVLANRMPDMSKMTMNRWHIYLIDAFKRVHRYGDTTLRVASAPALSMKNLRNERAECENTEIVENSELHILDIMQNFNKIENMD